MKIAQLFLRNHLDFVLISGTGVVLFTLIALFGDISTLDSNNRQTQKVLKDSMKALDKEQKEQQQVIHGSPHAPLSYRTCAYFSYWSVYEPRNFTPSDLPISQLTNVFYAFFDIDCETGKVVVIDKWSSLEMPLKFSPRSDDIKTLYADGTAEAKKLKQLHFSKKTVGALKQLYQMKLIKPSLQTSMSIGGWGRTDGFKALMKDESKVEQFVSSCVSAMQEFGFDGVDLDWEYPSNDEEGQFLLHLVSSLKRKLSQLEAHYELPPDTFLITLATPASLYTLQHYPLSRLDLFVSFWNVMTYDFAGSWSPQTEYHSNLYSPKGEMLSVKDAMAYYVRNAIPPNKLIMGLPNYGRGFGNTDGYNKKFKGVGKGTSDEEGIYNYNMLPQNFKDNEKYDPEAVAAYSYEPISRTFVSYDTPRVVREKAKFVKNNGYGGAMWWEACGDFYFDNPEQSLLLNFVDELGGTQTLLKVPSSQHQDNNTKSAFYKKSNTLKGLV
ncbi:Putative chitinase [Komagataella phaffii CBS 7435]|uniref:chitinase n=2 Tax=Komagataella phaffii TaxID=460519 RepID=C4R3K2_KOMPG|nr:Sporulation-specific chitinase [Komagataella phaffii GS115]AOA63291.1 GQ67_03122T0 [Komagataella phaffii]CAH2450237.1 Putative chitinase [Komagataella phaffii CBS 7435]AOA68428.1 GQ68_03106T0 [Komagataella phaffii GS115]CAY70037.1 Sporulation-specific chitinase [Komagataella phaffii GS115]CCA40072.1 Putative chitinase [Komagataella phaffii CBS 7435]